MSSEAHKLMRLERSGCGVARVQAVAQSSEARRWLNKARAWLDHYRDGMPARAEEELGLDLHNWLEAHVLRREAEALIRSEGPRSGTEDRDRRVPQK